MEIWTINTKGPGNMQERKTAIKKFFNDKVYKCGIFLIQECMKHMTFWIDLPPNPDHWFYYFKEEASILINTSRYKTERFSAVTLQAAIDKLKRNSDVPQIVTDNFFPLTRGQFLKVFFNPEVGPFLLVSWHGLYLGQSVEKRRTYLNYLLIYCQMLMNNDNLSGVIIGGDFNINLSDVKLFADNQVNFRVNMYVGSKRRNKKGLKDFFVTTKNIDIFGNKTDYYTYDDGDNAPLDHDPVGITVSKIMKFKLSAFSVLESKKQPRKLALKIYLKERQIRKDKDKLQTAENKIVINNIGRIKENVETEDLQTQMKETNETNGNKFYCVPEKGTEQNLQKLQEQNGNTNSNHIVEKRTEREKMQILEEQYNEKYNDEIAINVGSEQNMIYVRSKYA